MVNDDRTNSATLYPNSVALKTRASAVLTCQGAQTLSKARHGNGDYPSYITHGRGSRVWCADGLSSYLDYTLALGPVILGHAYPAVTDAVIKAVQDGPLHSLEHPLTVQVAELLTAVVPGAEKVRYLKTGSEANSAAIRAARVYTNRPIVAVHGYHGHGVEFAVNYVTERDHAGVPDGLKQSMIPFEYGDIESLETVFKQHKGKVAAVLLEPARTFEPPAGYLQAIRKLCDKHGTVLIFDEVVTGFRWARGGAAEKYGVIPDLTVIAKGAANGFCFAAVCGKAAIMDAFDRCFVSSTYAGDTVGLSAAAATIQVIMNEPVIEHLWRLGKRHREAFNHIMGSVGVPAHANGVDVCWIPTFEGEHAENLRSLYLQEMALRGILPGTISYISYSHSDEDLNYTIERMGFVAGILRKAMEEGKTKQDGGKP